MTGVHLWERKTDQVVSAELLPEMTLEQRECARSEHDHWDWDEKSDDLKLAAYRCLSIGYEGEIQGLMMISTLAVEGRLPAHKGKPVLYVKYIESAPWNR